ncbi:MAG: DUF4416 family protein [Elusimicrobiota bacterium]|nr:DUF4416 family protein [Elusimicrobiota bacterium]MDH5662058.1 DUF4416 family protein [Elusimicrobiota bacterium]
MAKMNKPLPVKLIMGMIATDVELFDKVTQILVGKFGPVDLKSDVFRFEKTDYYEEEIGRNLKRQFLSFSGLVEAKQIVEIKLFTNSLEEKFSLSKDEPSRLVNLDPGYLDCTKLVLASTKDSPNRIYLRDMIYAEIILYFSEGTFKPRPWTFPDYKSREYIETFNQIRKLYINERRNIISRKVDKTF